MIFINGKIRRNSSPRLLDVRPKVGAVCAAGRFEPRECPACSQGMIFNPRDLKCEPCLRLEADRAKAQKTINDLGNANRRAGR